MWTEIITGIIVYCIVIYLFCLYLDWGSSYVSSARYDSDKKDSFLYTLAPSAGLTDSKKYLLFWLKYYNAKL
jgi:hypothetical protein